METSLQIICPTLSCFVKFRHFLAPLWLLYCRNAHFFRLFHLSIFQPIVVPILRHFVFFTICRNFNLLLFLNKMENFLLFCGHFFFSFNFFFLLFIQLSFFIRFSFRFSCNFFYLFLSNFLLHFYSIFGFLSTSSKLFYLNFLFKIFYS